MRNIYILMTVLIAFVSGLALANEHYAPTESEVRQEFRDIGQYDPKYIGYYHDEMLAVCEKYDLTYDYEDTICK